MLAQSKVFPRPSLVLVAVGLFFLTSFLYVSGRALVSCPDCDFSGLRDRLPSLRYPSQHGISAKSPNGGVRLSSRCALPACAGFPDTSSVLPIMRTGASEALNKVPIQMATVLSCVDDYLVFSDREQNIAGLTVHDSLDNVLPEVKVNNSDFEIYLRQRDCPVSVEECNKNFDFGKEGWNLDKYKFVHVAEKAYAMRPNYSWYLFTDADTYIGWATLMPWLEQLDPLEEHYIGSVAFLNNIPFGHGGSGFIVSKAAMQRAFEGRTNVANKYDKEAVGTCCGDYVFAVLLKEELGLAPVHTWPTINGEKPHTLPYEQNEWCHPIATMHHVSAEEVSDLYAFERERNFSSPVRVKDLYYYFVESRLVEQRDDWDNLSKDKGYKDKTVEVGEKKGMTFTDAEKKAHQSLESCQRACEDNRRCLQYKFRHGECYIGERISHGFPVREKDEKKRPFSRWMLGRIRNWTEEHSQCDEPVKYPIVDDKAETEAKNRRR